jgi:hypothetical protein
MFLAQRRDGQACTHLAGGARLEIPEGTSQDPDRPEVAPF